MPDSERNNMMHTMRVFPALLLLVHGNILFAQAQLPDGFEIVQITDDPFYDAGARINNCGQIVFSRETDGTWEGNEIFLYDNGALTQLTDDDIPDRLPDINDDGVIVWQKGFHEYDPPFPHTVFIHEAGVTTEFGTGSGPVINNRGNMLWTVFSGEDECTDGVAEKFFYDGDTVRQLTDNGESN